MTQKENKLLASPKVDRLATLVEEATRATKDSPRRFIEPARGTLDRAKSRRHHIVFGRRGSGKTSLLRKAGADLTLDRVPIAFIDLEAFKGHTYPDVLLSVLIETLNAFSAWLADGGIERLVLASGGVARDFLTIFRRAIDVARERGETYRGDRINAEDINMAAGEHDTAKRDELKRDTLEERTELERALLVIQHFCLGNNVNCFLVERDVESGGQEVLGELVDLRFVHVVQSRTTVRDLPGKLFTAYMLDISQYTGERRRRELQMISFWRREEIDQLRRSKYVLSLSHLGATPPNPVLNPTGADAPAG